MPGVEREKVLLLAYLNNPEWVSVPLEGYQEYAQLRQLFDVTLVTHVTNAAALRRAGIADASVVYVDLGVLDRIFHAIPLLLKLDYGSQKRTALNIPYYLLFELAAWFKLRQRIKAGEFRLVHRLTPVSPVLASPFATLMARLKTPFTLGPINGGLPWPAGYDNANKEKESIRVARRIFRYLPFAGATYRNAKAIIVGSSFNWVETAKLTGEGKLFFIHENGVPDADVVARRDAAQAPMRLCFLGRLVPYKNCNIVIRAAAPLLKAGQATLDIIGDGWDRAHLEQLVAALGITRGVTFHGLLRHADAMAVLATGDILTFPSIREFGGGVVVEAMARGLVPIVVNYGGPSDLVEDSYGYCLPLATEDATVEDLARILGELAADPARIRVLGEAARLQARARFTWEKKAEMIASVWRYAITGGPKPEMRPKPGCIEQYR